MLPRFSAPGGRRGGKRPQDRSDSEARSHPVAWRAEVPNNWSASPARSGSNFQGMVQRLDDLLVFPDQIARLVGRAKRFQH